MPLIKLKQLQAGQQLSKDVLNRHGRLLLKAGTLIEGKHLEILRAWGVVELDIVGDSEEHDEVDVSFATLPTAVRERLYQRLMMQFKHCNLHHPLIKELVLYQRTRLTRQYLKGEG